MVRKNTFIKKSKFIVSLTSFGYRVERLAPYAICSILSQTTSPDKIILWLSNETPIPRILKKFSKIGLEIRYCEDLKSYNKLVPALKEFPDDVLITADDDVFYPPNWFKQLKHAFLKDQSRIYSHRAHEIRVNNRADLLPYKEWYSCIQVIDNSKKIFPTGVGGILYPPKSLHPICTDKDEFLALAPKGDDVWFWAAAKLIGTQHSIIRNGYNTIKKIDPNENGLWIDNVIHGGNDIQLRRVIDRFPIIKEFIKRLEC